MNYSWKFGETTENFSWDGVDAPPRKSEKPVKSMSPRGFYSVMFAMLFIVAASYFTGNIIDMNGTAADASALFYDTGTSPDYSASVPVIAGVYDDAGGGEYTASLYELEHRARINGLADAYIENQTRILSAGAVK